jgi:serine/threonine-protein kinase
MAPELWRGEQASKASDIYALGVILYELVTGRAPFQEGQDGSSHDIAMDPVPPSSCVQGIDRRWDAAILPCLDPLASARPGNAAEVLATFQKKPLRKTPLVAVALVITASLIPAVREPILEHLRPAKVRLAILPAAGPEDSATMGGKVLENVSERIRRLRSGGAMVTVISPTEMLSGNIRTLEQAKAALNATHALQLKLQRNGSDIEAKASLIELATQTHLREFSGSYSPEIAGDMPRALTGAVSSSLRLAGNRTSEFVAPAAREPLDRALHLLHSDRYGSDQAITLFQEAARLDPHSPLPPAGLAEAQILKFHATKLQTYLDNARHSLDEAEALDPDSVSVHLAAGLLNQTTGLYGKALEDYQRALDIEPRNIDALLRSALIYDSQNMPDKAIENCRKAIDFEPGSSEPYQYLGAFYYHRGKYLLAAEQFQKAIDHDHGLADAYINLGAAMSDLGRQTEAEQALLTSLTIKESARALNSLGAIRDYQGRDADAAGYYRRAVAVEPSNTIYWLNLGDSERRLGHRAEMRTAFRKVKDMALVELKQNPHRGYIRAFVAYSRLRLGDNVAAEEEISQALHSAAGNAQVIHFAVLIYEALGQRDRAIEVLNGSPQDVVQEIKSERELSSLHRDPRFVQLTARSHDGGH